MKEKINILTRFKISMFNVKNYSLLLKDGLIKSFVHILILSILVGSVLGGIQFTILNKLEKETKILLQQEDFKFEISNNLLDFKNSPYKYEKGTSVVIIDSNKTLDEVSSFKTTTVHKDISYVFLKDGFVARIDSSEFKMKYSEILFVEGNINNDIVIKALDEVKVVKYIVVVVMIIATYFIAIAKALLISIVGIMSNNIIGTNLKYKDILKISLYAITLPMVLEVIIPISNYSIIIAGVYVIVTINSIKNEQNIKL
ncbi:MAG: DUF1189 family protein [Clostridium sp.]